MAISQAHSFSLSTLRGVLIALGIGLLAFLGPRHNAEETGISITGIVIGLAMQLVWWLAIWLVKRYEQNHNAQGVFQPTVVFILELLIDAVTIALFAYTVLQGWWQMGHAI